MSFDYDVYSAWKRRRDAALRRDLLSCGHRHEPDTDVWVRGCCDWLGCQACADLPHECVACKPETVTAGVNWGGQ